MTDDRTPTPSCPDLRDNLPELALGTLAGRERATTLAHLTTCSACSAEVEHLSATGDALLSLAPEVEPPEGFADRVRERFGQGGLTSGDTADPSGPGVARTDPPTVGGPGASADAPGPPYPAPAAVAPADPPHPAPAAVAPAGTPRASRHRRRTRILAVAAAVVVAVALAFGAGWAASSHHPQGRTVGALARAPLSSAGRTIGVAATYVAPRPHITMRIDDEAAQGTVSCEVVLRDGRALRVGTFWLAGGYGAWSAPLPVPAAQVTLARVVSSSGAVLATARLAA